MRAQLLRWKGGAPDVSSKTSRAFATTSATTRVQIKELLLPELSERASLKTILDAVNATVNATAAAEAPADEAPSAGGLRRLTNVPARGMRRVFSLSSDLAGLGALGSERAIRQPSRVLPSTSSSFATSSSIGTDLADAADDADDAEDDWGLAHAEVQSEAKEVQSEAPSSAAASAPGSAPSSAAASAPVTALSSAAASAPVTTPLAAANGLWVPVTTPGIWVPPSPGAVMGAGLWVPVASAGLAIRSPPPPPSAATSSAASSSTSSPTANRPPPVEAPPQQARGLGAVPGGGVPGSSASTDGASTASAASLPTPPLPLPLASLTSPLPASSPTHVGTASPSGSASEIVSPADRPPLTSTASKSERTAALLASISRAHAAQAQRSY